MKSEHLANAIEEQDSVDSGERDPRPADHPRGVGLRREAGDAQRPDAGEPEPRSAGGGRHRAVDQLRAAETEAGAINEGGLGRQRK